MTSYESQYGRKKKTPLAKILKIIKKLSSSQAFVVQWLSVVEILIKVCQMFMANWSVGSLSKVRQMLKANLSYTGAKARTQ